jgi:hypothetical protein
MYSARKKKYVNQRKKIASQGEHFERMKIGCGGREYTSQGDSNERQNIASLALFFHFFFFFAIEQFWKLLIARIEIIERHTNDPDG